MEQSGQYDEPDYIEKAYVQLVTKDEPRGLKHIANSMLIQ